jgi:tRNA A37 threonylcarbamoyladenosine synthetase subunit TsaC/SUA5/YrdC
MKIRTVKILRRYGQKTIEHIVTEADKDSEIKIEMPLEPFIFAVIERVIFTALERVGNPLLLFSRAGLEQKIRTGFAGNVDAAIDAEVSKMKESTVYRTSEAD